MLLCFTNEMFVCVCVFVCVCMCVCVSKGACLRFYLYVYCLFVRFLPYICAVEGKLVLKVSVLCCYVAFVPHYCNVTII